MRVSQSRGQLTGLGMTQAYKLGEFLKERYMTGADKLMDENYFVSPFLKDVGSMPLRNLGSTAPRTALASWWPCLRMSYDAPQVFVRSTDVDRTLMTATSVLRGM